MAGNFKINSLLEVLCAYIPDIFPSKSLRQAEEAPQCEIYLTLRGLMLMQHFFSRNLFCVAELAAYNKPRFLLPTMANKTMLQTQPLQPHNKGKWMTTTQSSSAACESGSSTWLCRNSPPQASPRSLGSLTLQSLLSNFFTWLVFCLNECGWAVVCVCVWLRHLQQSQIRLEITHTLHVHTVQRCTHNTSISGCRYDDYRELHLDWVEKKRVRMRVMVGGGRTLGIMGCREAWAKEPL